MAILIRPFLWLAVAWAAVACSQTPDSSAPAAADLETALQAWQIIGEGSDFITVMVPIAPAFAGDIAVTGSVLDAAGQIQEPVTALSWGAEQAPAGHLWLSFVLFAPGREGVQIDSRSIELRLQYTAAQGPPIHAKHQLRYAKSWGDTLSPEIYDRPIPPQLIDGKLFLNDYTFVAAGDARKTVGPYLSGHIEGQTGRWSGFSPSSIEIADLEENPDGLQQASGWLLLSDARTYPADAQDIPPGPRVRGWWDGKGMFHPQGRVVP